MSLLDLISLRESSESPPDLYEILGGHVFFAGIDLSVAKDAEVGDRIKHFALADVNEHFLSMYPNQIIEFIASLPDAFIRFLKATNGVYSVDGRISLCGIPLNRHTESLYLPTSLFATNLLEVQPERRKGEIFIGALDKATIRLFINSKSGSIFGRARGENCVDSHAFGSLSELLGAK